MEHQNEKSNYLPLLSSILNLTIFKKNTRFLIINKRTTQSHFERMSSEDR